MKLSVICFVFCLSVAYAAPAYHWRVLEEKHNVHVTRPGESSSTYLSQGIPLAPGFVVNTNPQDTPITFPAGKLAITSFIADIVTLSSGVDPAKATAADYVPTPLDELYVHHWLVFNGRGNYSPCQGLQYLFGVGAESRNTITAVPSPYGWIQNGTEQYTANIHVISERNVYDIKSCIECFCPWGGGRIACCEGGTQCPVQNSPSNETRTYYLRYTVTWCNIYSSGCLQTQSYGIQVPWDVNIVFAVGHQHIGGQGTDMQVYNSQTGEVSELCTSNPRYGTTKGQAGNELNYVVEMGACTFNPTVFLPASSYLIIHNTYSTTPARGGTMGLMYVAFNSTQASREEHSVPFSLEPMDNFPPKVLSAMHSRMYPGLKKGPNHGHF